MCHLHLGKFHEDESTSGRTHREWTQEQAQTQVLAESQEKLRLQMAVEEVEREVQTRYPVLKSQREEVDRLRSVSKQLTVQTRGSW